MIISFATAAGAIGQVCSGSICAVSSTGNRKSPWKFSVMQPCPPPPTPYIVYVDDLSKTAIVSSIKERAGTRIIALTGFVRPGEEQPVIAYRLPAAVITVTLDGGKTMTYSLDDMQYCGSRGCTYFSAR